MNANEIIRAFLLEQIEAGQAAFEMVQDGYNGDVDEYVADYSGDYEVITENGETIVHRIDYPEYWEMTGAGFVKMWR